jgi:hypothetical protein
VEFDRAIIEANWAYVHQAARVFELQFLIRPLERLGQRERLAYVLERITELEPRNAIFLRDYALGLANLGRHDEARAVLKHALELEPSDPIVLEFLSWVQMRAGNFVEGFRNREVRWRTGLRNLLVNELSIPWWLGESLKGRRLLLFCESNWGLGDSIQYVRYLRPLCQRAEKEGATIELRCHAPLVSFFERNFSSYNCLSIIPNEGEEVDEFLKHHNAQSATAMMVLGPRFKSSLRSMPLIFGGPLSDADARAGEGDTPCGGYLHADQEKAAAWRARLSNAEGLGVQRGTHWSGLKVGLSWTGRSDHPRKDLRDYPVEGLVEALRRRGAGAGCPDLNLYSLQQGHSETAQALGLIDWTSELCSMEDTAAFVSSLDLVVSIDGMLGHLAGALGVPVWVLVDVGCHYTWMGEGHSTPWYRSARVFRQKQFKDWTNVFDEVRDALEARIEAPALAAG